jgi:hypothetical protein
MGMVIGFILMWENLYTCYRHNLAINMYPRLLMKQQKQQTFTNNSRRIATPVSGFLQGKCYAAPIMLRVIGAALSLPIIFVFLMLKHC